MKNLFQHKYIVTPLIATLLISCEDFLEVAPPKSKIVSETVFSSDATATAAITGIYHQMLFNGGFASGYTESVTYKTGLSSDELNDYSTFQNPDVEFYLNEITAVNTSNLALWSSAYTSIYQANSVIEGLVNSKNVTSKTKDQLEGEAKFIRAFAHFYLVNSYGDIPLITTTDYRENSGAARISTGKVYEQIIRDLIDARSLLSDEYVVSQRIRPNKAAATALLARAYLYVEDWLNAELMATEVIQNSNGYSLLSDLNQVFIANSNEAIWQLAQVGFGSTFEGFIFIRTSAPTNSSPALTVQLVSAFEEGDQRLNNWIGSFNDGSLTYYFPYKYKVQFANGTPTEYSMVLRLAEQYLIRAEARAQQGKLTGPNSAESDINVIRNRAGLSNTTEVTKEGLLTAILQERRAELFTEWGHRWFDLKRFGLADEVLGAIKDKWNSTDKLYPIPETEMLKDPNLKPQNPGY